jgi:hypothetical protein
MEANGYKNERNKMKKLFKILLGVLFLGSAGIAMADDVPRHDDHDKKIIHHKKRRHHPKPIHHDDHPIDHHDDHPDQH